MKRWWALTAKCLQALCGLIESNTLALEGLTASTPDGKNPGRYWEDLFDMERTLLLETKRAVTRDSNGNEQDGDDSPDGSEEHHHTSEDGEDTGTQTEEKIGK